MIETPHIAESEAQAAAVIHISVPRDQIQPVMEAAIKELTATVSGQGLSPAGPLFAHHLKLSTETFDFEVGIPVSAPVAPAGRVKPGELPAAKVVRTVHHGGYEGLFAAWAEFGERSKAELGELMKKQGLKPGKTLWERYLVGPESSSDPANWRTELNRPLVAVSP